MPASVQLYQIEGKHAPLLHNLFFNKKTGYVYGTLGDNTGPSEPLKVNFEPRALNDGAECVCYLDVAEPIFAYGEATRTVKASRRVYLRTYQDGGLNVLATFAPKPLAFLVAEAMLTVVRKNDATASGFLRPIGLNLQAKERQLRDAFGEVRRFAVTDILNDPHVTSTRMGGVQLDESDVYSKYVHKSGGRLSSILFKWNGRSIMLAEDGRLLLYAKFESDEQASLLIRSVLDTLKGIGLI